jgi:hypothetical protein
MSPEQIDVLSGEEKKVLISQRASVMLPRISQIDLDLRNSISG